MAISKDKLVAALIEISKAPLGEYSVKDNGVSAVKISIRLGEIGVCARLAVMIAEGKLNE